MNAANRNTDDARGTSLGSSAPLRTNAVRLPKIAPASAARSPASTAYSPSGANAMSPSGSIIATSTNAAEMPAPASRANSAMPRGATAAGAPWSVIVGIPECSERLPAFCQ